MQSLYRAIVVSFIALFCHAQSSQAIVIAPGGSGTTGTVTYASGNLALSGTATQTSTRVGSGANVASAAIDGNTNGEFIAGNSTTHTANSGPGEFWQVDLGTGEFAIDSVTIFGRSDCCQNRLAFFDIDVINTATGGNFSTAFDLRPGNVPTMSGTQTNPPAGLNHDVPDNTIGDIVRIVQNDTEVLSLAEVQVFGLPNLTLDPGDTIEIELGPSSLDFVDVEGSAALSGTIDVSTLPGLSLMDGQTFDVLTAATIDTSGLSITGGSADGFFAFTFQTVAGGNGQILQLQALLVPEPSTAALVALGMLGCAAFRRRRAASTDRAPADR